MEGPISIPEKFGLKREAISFVNIFNNIKG